MSQAVFITATDTDAGKTWVSSHLVHALLEQRENAKAIKPIACGLNADGINEDIKILLQAQGLHQPSAINCYSLAKAAAPAIAAQAEGKSIDPKHLKTWCLNEIAKVDVCLMEAIGGLMVPITQNYLVSDWLVDMPHMPVILIVGAKLGCINHALLSLSHLSNIGREPAWVIINNSDATQNTHDIKKALSPYIGHNTNIIECDYNKPSHLSPIIRYLKDTLKSKP